MISRIDRCGFQYAIFDSIDFVPAGVWDRLNAENDIFLSSAYLRGLEKAPPANMTFKYAIVHVEGIAAAIAYFQILKVDSKLNKLFVVPLKMLVCGNALLCGQHCFAARNGLDRSKLMKGIAEVIERIRQAENIDGKVNAVMIKDFNAEQKGDFAPLIDAGYYDYNAGPNMVIPIRKHWVSFEQYVADLKPKYQKRVTSTIRKGRELRRKTLSFEEIDLLKDVLNDLYMQVFGRSKFKMFRLNSNMLPELKRHLSDKFEVVAYYQEDTLVAFTTRIFNGNDMEGYCHGLDYAYNKTFDLYLNILLDDIRTAISRRATKLNLGRTSNGMKSSLGAIPNPVSFVMKLKLMIPNVVIKTLSRHVKPVNEAYRNPFINP